LVAPDVDGFEDNYRVTDGYDEVPRRLAAGSDLRANHVALAILRREDGVDVVTSRGVYSGNVAVVCLPVGVLQGGGVRFDPPLTPAKAAVIGSINAGTATKLVLCFRRNTKGRTFWPKDMPLLATSLATQLWWPTGWGYSDQRRFLASCLVGGAAVARFGERDPRRVGLAQLTHMFGRGTPSNTCGHVVLRFQAPESGGWFPGKQDSTAMPGQEPAREYIHAMIGHRTRISEAERDVPHQLLNTPAVRARFPSPTHEELCAIADSLVGQALPTPCRKWRRQKTW
jgi:hypothetical protein